MTVITMSRNELTRLRVLIDVADERLSVADARGLIGVGRNGRPSEKVISDHSTVRTSPLPGLDGSGISSPA